MMPAAFLAFLAAAFTPAVLNAASIQGQPPPGITLAPPPFHFSDPAMDREFYRLDERVSGTSATYRGAIETARTALAAARGSRPGSPSWRRARAAIEQAIRARRPLREASLASIAFLDRASQRAPAAEAGYATEVRTGLQEGLRASSDLLVDLLARLAGIPINQWPP